MEDTEVEKNKYSDTVLILLGHLRTIDWKEAIKNEDIDFKEASELYSQMEQYYGMPEKGGLTTE